MKALAHFVKRVDFETVARLTSVAVVSDGKSEADLIWLALAELRSALAEAGAVPPRAASPPVTAASGPGQSPRLCWVRP
jgi:glucose-6-phosphate dehydrogenase assembly protein OpcA